jgi:hypothetical protein
MISSILLDHKENKEILSNHIVRQLFKRLSLLLDSLDVNIQIEAGHG